MVTERVNVSAAFAPAPQHWVGPGALWDCPCPELRAHHRRHLLGVSARARRSDRPRTPPRWVARGRPQTWRQTGRPAPHAGGRDLLCPLAPLGRRVVCPDMSSPGVGDGRLDLGAAGDRAPHECGQARRCPPRGLADRRGHAPWRLRPPGEALFGHGQGRVPADGTVMVRAARGLDAPWGFTTRQAVGWHPCLRSNRHGHDRPQASATWRPLTQVVSRLGQRWAGPGVCCPTPVRQRTCPLLARGDTGYRAPWLVLTDLPAPRTEGAW